MGKILNIIFFIIILVFLPLGELARIDSKGDVAFIGLDIIVGLFFVLFLLSALIRKLTRERNSKSVQTTNDKLLKPVGLFVGVCIISLIINSFALKANELLVASLYLIRWVSYIGIYFFVRQTKKNFKEKISFILILSGVLVVLIGYLQFFLYPNLRNLAYLGWDVHLYRMFGEFLDPNFFGAFLVLYLLFVFSRLWTIRSGTKTKISLIILIFVTVLAIFLTYSRSAYLMLAIGLICFFSFKKLSQKILFASTGVIFVCLGLVFILTRYSEGTNLLRINSTKARITTSENALIIFQRNPLFGVGFNAYRYAQERYHLIDETKNLVSIDHGGAGSDNSFLFVLATTGIVGFFAYCYFWFVILRENRNPLIISSLLALFAGSFFINSLFYPFIMLWMWVLLGIMNS